MDSKHGMQQKQRNKASSLVVRCPQQQQHTHQRHPSSSPAPRTSSSSSASSNSTSKCNLTLYKTKPCVNWNGISCRYGDNCNFAHGPHDLRPATVHPKYKTQRCREWYSSSLHWCPFNKNCVFRHGDEVDENGQPLDPEEARESAFTGSEQEPGKEVMVGGAAYVKGFDIFKHPLFQSPNSTRSVASSVTVIVADNEEDTAQLESSVQEESTVEDYDDGHFADDVSTISNVSSMAIWYSDETADDTKCMRFRVCGSCPDGKKCLLCHPEEDDEVESVYGLNDEGEEQTVPDSVFNGFCDSGYSSTCASPRRQSLCREVPKMIRLECGVDVEWEHGDAGCECCIAGQLVQVRLVSSCLGDNKW